MPLPSIPTRSSATEEAYRRRARILVKRARKMLGLVDHDPLDYCQFVGWMIAQKPRWSRATWRQYKASVIFSLEEEVRRHNDPVAEEAIELLLPVDVTGCVTRTRKTSGAKLKRFPLRDYRALERSFAERPSPWSQDLIRWIASSLLTGLRPKEWAQARVTTKDGEPALVVQNAKTTNQRSHGPTRTLLIGGLSQDERKMIDEQVARATQWHQAGQFDKFYHGCAAALSRRARQLWPRRPQRVTLYSARHQFTADAKASGFTLEEIAAMMGHAVDTTASRHYGKRTAGDELVRIMPLAADVARVRQVYQQRFTPKQPTPSRETQPKPGLDD